MSDLRGAVALVTGSMSGIGQGIADRLTEAGVTVVRNSRSCPADATHLPGDVADEQTVNAMVARVILVGSVFAFSSARMTRLSRISLA